MSYHLNSVIRNEAYYESLVNDSSVVKYDREILDMFAKSAWSYCRQDELFVPTVEQLWEAFNCCIEEHLEMAEYEGVSRTEFRAYKRALKEFEPEQMVESLNRHKLTYRMNNIVYNESQTNVFDML